MMRFTSPSKSLVFLVLAALGGDARGAEIDAPRLFRQLDANADGQLAVPEVGNEHRLLFKRLARSGDEDGNGRLSAEEFAAALQPIRAEKVAVEKQGSRLPGADALIVVVTKMDASGDRQLEAGEIPAPYRRVFVQMLEPGDDNNDGKLDQREIAKKGPRLSVIASLAAARMRLDIPAELAKLPDEQMESLEQMDAYARPGQMLADPAQAELLFTRLDVNGDKRLAADEAPAALAPRFEKMLARGDRDGDEHLNKQEFLAMSRRLARFQKFAGERGADVKPKKQRRNKN